MSGKTFGANDPTPAEDIWVQRINAISNGLVKIITASAALLSPVLTVMVLWFQSQNKAEVKEDISKAKEAVTKVSEDAASNAKVAADRAVEAKEEAKEAKIIAGVNRVMSEAGVKNWKAWKSKDESEGVVADEAIAAAERASEIRPAMMAPPIP